MKIFVATMSFIVCLGSYCFPMSVEELQALDSTKIAAMSITELTAVKDTIDQQIYSLRSLENHLNQPSVQGGYTVIIAPENLKLIHQFDSVYTIVNSRIILINDDAKYSTYNAFNHIGSYHQRSGRYVLASGIVGLALTIILPATNTTTVYNTQTNKNEKKGTWGWWMLASGGASIFAIHLGLTEIKLGTDLRGYGARVSIPIKCKTAAHTE